MRLTYEQLQARYYEMTARVVAKCQAATPLVGGVTASEAGVRAFIKHHLQLEGDEAQKAFERICREELGERDITPDSGELKEQLTYGINVIRRTANGPYLGNWMIHANIKTAMSRLGIFMDLRGSKGNIAEGGMVRPHGMSKRDERPDCVYLMAPDGTPATTYFDEFKGRVSSPQGSKSIIHHSECVPAGTRFEFEFAFLRGQIKDQDVIDVLALCQNVGIGSVKSLGHGKFEILDAEIFAPEKEHARPKKEAKKAKEEEVAV